MIQQPTNALPDGWAATVLPNLLGRDGEMTDGDWVESKDQDPGGEVRLIQLADIGDGVFRDRSDRFLTLAKAKELRCTLLQTDDVLVARMPDPLGRACLVPPLEAHWCTVVDVCILRTGTKSVSPRWLTHFINAPQFRVQIADLQSGSTRKRISKKNLGTIPIPVPPEREQRAVAEQVESFLSRLDAAVAGLKRVQANLKRYRASVLKAAVEGRLVPTEAELAKAEGRTYEPASELLARILKERRARWEAAELASMKAKGKPPKNDEWKSKHKEPAAPDTKGLPELPEGWCWATIGQAFSVHVGATPRRSVAEYWGGSIPWASSGEVAFCRINGTRESITEAGLANTSTQVNPIGSVLLGMIGEGKTRGQVAILDVAACNNQNSAAIWVSETPVVPEFVYYFLMEQYEVTRRRGSGNNQPALSGARVRAIPMPLPPIPEQQRVVAEIDTLLSISEGAGKAVQQNKVRLARLRQSILKWGFEGKLVDQDPNDEPASALLERIRAEREATAPGKKRSDPKTRKKSNGQSSSASTPKPRRAKKARATKGSP